MKSKSFIIKILIWFIISIFFYYLLIFILYIPKLKKDNLNNTITNLKNLNMLIKYNIKNYLIINNMIELNNFIQEISKKINKRITIIDNNGITLADTDENPKFMEHNLTNEEIQKIISYKENISYKYSSYLKKYYIAYSEPIIIEKDNSFIILKISEYIDNIYKNIFFYIRNLILFSIIIFFLSIISILIIYYNFRKNILRFSEISDSVAKGDFNIKFNINNDYESMELSKSFNNMTAKLKDLFNDLNNEKEELNSIISYIKEGILIIDKNGIIIRTNNSFNKMFNNNNPIGKYYWEVIRNSDFEKLLKNINYNNKNDIKELELFNKIYLISINFISIHYQFVIIFYDLTDILNFERSKKEFISNVSHELNTPLSSIKGYIETLLEEEVDETRKNYLEIINKNTDRLINIVKDLLFISQIDENKNINFQENVNLNLILNNILVLFKDKITKKSLNLNLNIKEDLPLIKCDSFKIEQMFINLIENSIKYTEKGSISISLYDKDNNIVFEIEDTGIGIPEQELPKIFDRFYVIDKSRSKQNGGTGLGLSIVKNIVLLHKGKIYVDSKVKKGTKFTVLLPLC